MILMHLLLNSLLSLDIATEDLQYLKRMNCQNMQ